MTPSHEPRREHHFGGEGPVRVRSEDPDLTQRRARKVVAALSENVADCVELLAMLGLTPERSGVPVPQAAAVRRSLAQYQVRAPELRPEAG